MICITWIKDFLDILPSLMLYLAQGVIFISLYNFVLFKDKTLELNHMLIKSIVCSYILKSAFDLVLELTRVSLENDSVYLLILCSVSAVLSYVLAMCLKSKWFNGFLLKIGIRRTVRDNIWDEIIEPNMWLRIYLKDTEYAYLGQYKYGENFEREPIIILTRYQLMNVTTGDIIVDNSEDSNRCIVLNLKGFEKIDLVYDSEINED